LSLLLLLLLLLLSVDSQRNADQAYHLLSNVNVQYLPVVDFQRNVHLVYHHVLNAVLHLRFLRSKRKYSKDTFLVL
jgi:hypothetical protein